jgi:hypothetical protein
MVFVWLGGCDAATSGQDMPALRNHEMMKGTPLWSTGY